MSLFHIDAGKKWRGGQRQSLLLVRELARKGYPVWLVAQPRSPLHKKALEEGLPVLPVRIRCELDILAVLRLAWIMRRRECVTAHFHDAHSISVGKAAAALAGVPLRFAARRVDFPLRRHFLSRRKYVKGLDAVVAISKEVKRVLLRGGVPEGLIHVIPSGIDFAPFRKEPGRESLRKEFSFTSDDFLVGIVAQLEDHKGHRYLFEATKILKEKTRKLKIMVVGEGSLRLELGKQVKRLDVEDLVFFMGFRSDVPRILASLDLFVLSSHLEGLGTSIMDAMACRLPVIATRTGGIPEIVTHEETGLLVAPRDPEALAEAILTLYRNRKLAARLAENAYAWVHENFSAESTAAKTLALYEKLAARKGVILPEKAKAPSVQTR